jgi:hypothetical protein
MAKAKKEKPVLDVEKALTLYQITSELQQITDSIIENGGECDEQTFAALQLWQEEFTIKVEKICHVIASKIDGPRQYFERVKAAADAKIKQLDATEKSLKKYILRGMVDTDTKSIKRDDGLFSVSLCDGRTSVEILDEKKLPYKYVEIVEVIKKKTDLIKKDMEAGEKVEGARLMRGEPYLRIISKAAKAEGEKENG